MTKSGIQNKEVPKNLILFITDQERAHDLNYSQGFDDDLAGTKWLKKNGLSFSNAFTNTNQCSVARSTFFTSNWKFSQFGWTFKNSQNSNSDCFNSKIQKHIKCPNCKSGSGIEIRIRIRIPQAVKAAIGEMWLVYDTVFSRRIAEKRSQGLKHALLHSHADRQNTVRVIAVCLGQFGVNLGSVWG